jgi:hypothetical protein
MARLRVLPYHPHTEWNGDRSVTVAVIVFRATATILFLSLCLWGGNKICDVIDHLGAFPK